MPYMTSRPKLRPIHALSVAACLAVTVAGCSSSSSSTSTSTSSSPTATGSASASPASSVLGTPNKATGSPITIAILNPGATAAVDTTPENTAMKAAVAYANDYLGGINGHVIQVKECSTQDTPAGSTACSNQMIQANVAAAVQASGDDVTIKALNKAGILDFMNVGASPVALGTPTALSMANPLAVYGVPAAYAQQIGAKNAALLVIDVPGASDPPSPLGPLLFKNAGVTLKGVLIPQGTADMTPQVQTTLSASPKLYYVLGDPTFCTSAIKAIKTLAPTAQISMYYTCISPNATGIPGRYAAIKTAATQLLQPADP